MVENLLKELKKLQDCQDPELDDVQYSIKELIEKSTDFIVHEKSNSLVDFIYYLAI